MKKSLFIGIVTLWASTHTYAQMRDTTSGMNMHKIDADRLFKKAKQQNSAAWVVGGTGLGLAAVGLIITSNQVGQDLSNIFNPNYTNSNSKGGEIMAYAGLGAMLGSIPLFIASGKNKRKANLMLKDEKVSFNPQLNIKEHFISAGLKINL